MDLNVFPVEIKIKIFSYFTETELRRKVKPVSEEWRQLADSPYLKRCVQINSSLPQNVKLVLRKYCVVKHLKITLMKISDWIVDLPKCNFLKTVTFDSCRIKSTEVLSSLFEKFPSIRNLQISFGLVLKNDCLQLSPQWKLLKTLHLHFCNHATEIDNCTCVEFVIENCENMQDLLIGCSHNLNDELLTTLIQKRQSTLRKLSIDCGQLSDTGYHSLSTCTNLTKLHLVRALYLTDVGVLALRNLNNLQDLYITHGAQLTSTGYINLFSNSLFPRLLSINIRDCERLDDEGLHLIATSCPALQVLSLLAWTKKCYISDQGVQAIVDNCRDLTKLHLDGLTRVGGKFLKDITSKLPKLTYLNVKTCHVSGGILSLLRKRNPNIRINLNDPDNSDCDT